MTHEGETGSPCGGDLGISQATAGFSGKIEQYYPVHATHVNCDKIAGLAEVSASGADVLTNAITGAEDPVTCGPAIDSCSLTKTWNEPDDELTPITQITSLSLELVQGSYLLPGSVYYYGFKWYTKTMFCDTPPGVAVTITCVGTNRHILGTPASLIPFG